MRTFTFPVIFFLVALTGCSVFPVGKDRVNLNPSLPTVVTDNSACKTPGYVAYHCADTITASFDSSQRLWVAYTLNHYLYLQYSNDHGQHFSAPVQVNRDPENIAANGEYRPKIRFDAQNNVFLTWTQALEKRHTGHIRFARSTDEGKTFSTPVTINDNLDIISHRFDDILIGRNGEIFIAWLDAREREEARTNKHDFLGTTVYYTWSNDHGMHFHPNKPIHNHSCECCRLGVALDVDNLPVVIWRHVFEGQIRDQALIKFKDWNTPGQLQRASVDNWKIEACPHHGPSMTINQDGRYHMTWFSGAVEHQGLFYAHSDDHGEHFSDVLPFGKSAAKHPYIDTIGTTVIIVWSEFDGKNNLVQMMKSEDRGEHWSESETIGSHEGKSDYAFLINDGDSIYLSWQTDKGYHFEQLP